MTIAEEKALLRREMRARSHALPDGQRAAADAAIRAAVLASDPYRAAESVFAYLGVGWEIETLPLLRRILADGKRLALPLCVSPHEMEPRLVSDLGCLVPGAYGIPEPPAEAPRLSADAIGLTLVPCVAADRRGYRLGQGGGYYDAFLRRCRGTAFLLCREAALLPAIPLEPHDVPLSFLVTENGLFSLK